MNSHDESIGSVAWDKSSNLCDEDEEPRTSGLQYSFCTSPQSEYPVMPVVPVSWTNDVMA